MQRSKNRSPREKQMRTETGRDPVAVRIVLMAMPI